MTQKFIVSSSVSHPIRRSKRCCQTVRAIWRISKKWRNHRCVKISRSTQIFLIYISNLSLGNLTVMASEMQMADSISE